MEFAGLRAFVINVCEYGEFATGRIKIHSL